MTTYDEPTRDELLRHDASFVAANAALHAIIETLRVTVEGLTAIVADLHAVRAASHDDRQAALDEPIEAVKHVIGYRPPGTIGLGFDTNGEATAVTGGCSHEMIRRCRGDAEAAAFVEEVRVEIAAGVTVLVSILV